MCGEMRKERERRGEERSRSVGFIGPNFRGRRALALALNCITHAILHTNTTNASHHPKCSHSRRLHLRRQATTTHQQSQSHRHSLREAQTSMARSATNRNRTTSTTWTRKSGPLTRAPAAGEMSKPPSANVPSNELLLSRRQRHNNNNNNNTPEETRTRPTCAKCPTNAKSVDLRREEKI